MKDLKDTEYQLLDIVYLNPVTVKSHNLWHLRSFLGIPLRIVGSTSVADPNVGLIVERVDGKLFHYDLLKISISSFFVMPGPDKKLELI